MKKIKPLFVVFFFMVIHNAHAQPVLLRGPYLQTATSNSIIIKWRTDIATIGVVNYGTTQGFRQQITETASTTEHNVMLTGLTQHTKYFYSIGDAANVLQSDTGNYFYTLPIAGTEGFYRIAGFGDCGNNSTNQVNVKNSLLSYLGSNYLDAWLLLGDNAYDAGTETEFQSNYFNIYKNDLLKKYPLFPSPGNHDYANDNNNQISHSVPYFNIFSTPTNAESGGTASGTKAYYSFDIGNIHFLALDSYGIDNGSRMSDTLGPQAVWLKKDLDVNANKGWIVAYFHHPPFTYGSHNSDNETELVDIRKNFIPILERYHVDLVLSGHSHVYERSSFMNGYYGNNSSFNAATYDVSTSNGTYNGSANSCPYAKSSNNTGTVYLVAGSAGQLGGTQAGFPMNAMQFSDAAHGGVLMLEVQANRLDAKWICADGQIRDKFTIMKRVNTNTTININQGDKATLTASYIGKYNWSNAGETSRTIQVTPSTSGNYRYIVQDEFGCIKDTFNVNVAPIALPVKLIDFNGIVTAENGALLNWKTASELNSDKYVVQCSSDAVSFTNITSIKSINNMNGASYSQLINNLKQGYNFFRLQIIDNDGHFTLSKTVTLWIGTAAQKISAFPNPYKNSLSITGALQGSELILMDENGKHLLKQAASGRGIDIMNTNHLAAGTYILQVIATNGDIKTLKVFKQ